MRSGREALHPSHHLVVEPCPAGADLALLEEKVAAAAAAAAGVGEAQDLAIFVRDDRGRLVAGVCGVIAGDYCELQAMWVDDPLRGQGWARTLMAAAESEARRRGCALMIFHSYDVLTGGLYERLGYQTVAVIDGCLAGTAVLWHKKAL